ncbi:MAG: dynamin family protein [Candidatus Onthovivens sp.]|nr:dynamin family protein [Candidatus Onthovivens sp.]
MALFEDESYDLNEEKNVENVYLIDEKKGLELVKKIFIKCNNISTEKFENIIFNKFFPLLAKLDIENELSIYQILTKICKKIKEQKKIKLLKNKSVLGIGGKFSAGKSCFINSITNTKLPEGQRPTTSIATYIVKSEKKGNIALTSQNNSIFLDDEAILALTHEFYEKYKIGFSRVINNLVICTSDFVYSNIAILDTPGYSKADISKNNDASDAEIAREQLKTVDYLIWLVDCDNGVIKENDLEFIDSLNISTPILVVFNKAGLKSFSEVEQIVTQSKDLLEGSSKEIFDVIAYDSHESRTVIGEGVLEKFLNMVDSNQCYSTNIVEQLNETYEEISSQIDKQINVLHSNREQYGNALINAIDVNKLGSIINKYSKEKVVEEQFTKTKQEINNIFKELISIANNMDEV